MASVLSLVNRLLPFATPGTPLIQDLVHLGAICTLLYYAPQLQQWIQIRQHQPETPVQHQQEEGEDAGQDLQGENAREQAGDVPERPPGVVDVEEGAVDDDQDEDQLQPGLDAPFQDGQAGPANPAAAVANQRNVGAKKAKSLARRDQRRAYHEFQRSQGEAQRARDAEGAAEREAALAAERERRKAVEAAVEAKKAKEREQKRESEKKQREEEIRRRELAVRLVREGLEQEGMCDLFRVSRQLGNDADEEWVERILKASGLLGMKDGKLTMVTSVGWAVRVSNEQMQQVYREALETGTSGEDGAISYERLGGMLEDVLRRSVPASA